MAEKLTGVRIQDLESTHNGQIVDIEITDGLIKSIKPSSQKNTNLIVSPGLFELRAHFEDPGNEHRETLQSGLDAAKDGGFTDVCLLPNTTPCIDSKGQLDYVLGAAERRLVNLHPYGAVSVGAKGEGLAEMIDLAENGAVAFTDGLRQIEKAELLLRALQYASKIDKIVINCPMDYSLAAFGQMHEGDVSTELGLKGIPAVAEVIMLERDISLLGYTGGKLHVSGISCAASVDLIKKAKKQGLSITCDVYLDNLLYTDEDLLMFDTNFKLVPPLRDKTDQRALLDGLKRGIIDAISCNHLPLDREAKNLEFDLAESGTIGLQTAFSSLLALGEKLPLDLLLNKMGNGARRVLGLPEYPIEVGNEACLSLFDTATNWTFGTKTNLSKSQNSPLFGHQLTGRSLGVVSGKLAYFRK